MAYTKLTKSGVLLAARALFGIICALPEKAIFHFLIFRTLLLGHFRNFPLHRNTLLMLLAKNGVFCGYGDEKTTSRNISRGRCELRLVERRSRKRSGGKYETYLRTRTYFDTMPNHYVDVAILRNTFLKHSTLQRSQLWVSSHTFGVPLRVSKKRGTRN